jgi:hypothetical protein
VTPDNANAHFPPTEARNVGVLNGAPSGNVLDVDLDCSQALTVAPRLLPATGWIFGHKSAPRSHWIYRTDRTLDVAQEKFADLDGAVQLELRGTGGLTVYPPSTHKETGERVAWERFTDLANVPLSDLQRAVRKLAAAALLSRHWPAKGSRDAAAMALTGGLLRASWPEDDVSRFVEAVALAAGDEEHSSRGKKSAPTVRKQQEDKATTGWPTLEQLLSGDGPGVVRRVREWLGLTTPAQTVDPTPDQQSWPNPPGQEAFHGLPGRIVRTIEPASEADPVALLVQILVAFGNIIGRGAHFQVEADRHYGNEFVVLVGRTSKARKGTSWGHIHRLMHDAEEQWTNERVQSGASSGEGIIWAVRDPITTRERIKERGEAVRYEDVEKDPGIADKRLLVYEPEFANVLKQTERTGNTLSVILRNAWDGNSVLRSLTKNSPARATGAHVSMIGHITSEELRRNLTATETANGFGNRFLWVCAERSKLLPLGGRVDPAAMDALRCELTDAIAFARTVREMRRDEQATALWCDFYGQLSEGKPGLAGALLARAEAHVMRLALLYALLDRSMAIGATHLLAALALWDYCDRSVYHVFGDDLGDPVADELLRLLRGSPDGLTRTDMLRFFGNNLPSGRIGKALGLLLQHHLARREEEKTAGRPAECWFAVTRSR